MEEQGVIIESRGPTVLIKTKRTSSCDGCTSKKSCATVGENEMVIEADNPVGAHVGDRVLYEVGAASVIKAGLLLYLVPVVSFIVGVVLGQSAGPRYFPQYNSDLVSGLMGVGFLVIAFVGLKIYSATAERRRSFRPHVLRKV